MEGSLNIKRQDVASTLERLVLGLAGIRIIHAVPMGLKAIYVGDLCYLKCRADGTQSNLCGDLCYLKYRADGTQCNLCGDLCYLKYRADGTQNPHSSI
jgi:hypothetical protein